MINIYNQDCMEAMKEMSENQFDLAIVDPPFGIGNFVQTNRGEKVDWNDEAPTDVYFKELKRVSKNTILFFYDMNKMRLHILKNWA